MGLTQAQRTTIEKARYLGAGAGAIVLDDIAAALLLAVMASDLGLIAEFPELPDNLPPFYSPTFPGDTTTLEGDFLALFERFVAIVPDADTYFFCLATLFKHRLKYERILETQPRPTIDQVGPRGLLHYGIVSSEALVGFLFWRKWMYDIDNRAAQETGYLFEPIIANSIGGVPVPASRSPIRRHGDPTKGRQVDCLLERRAYEIKLRVTIAASGQGRWREELGFPLDCRTSGYAPVLVVLDPTSNPKLQELDLAFRNEGGEVYIGANAWAHLSSRAGDTMSVFLRKYVQNPIEDLLRDIPRQMPDLVLRMSDSQLTVSVGDETFSVRRDGQAPEYPEPDALPDDVDEQTTGP